MTGDQIKWHSFHGKHVDMDVMHDQANRKMRDKRDPSSTVVHDHPNNIPCKGHEHTVYNHRDESKTDKIYIEDGYETWGIADPQVKMSS